MLEIQTYTIFFYIVYILYIYIYIYIHIYILYTNMYKIYKKQWMLIIENTLHRHMNTSTCIFIVIH